jgi:hypothetical protein
VLPPLLRMAKYFHEDVRSKAMYALAQVRFRRDRFSLPAT